MSGVEVLGLVAAAIGAVGAIRAGLRARLRRRLAAGERAALAASIDDDRFDPARIHAAAAALYKPLAGTFLGDEVEPHIRLFGTGQIRRMFSLGSEPQLAPKKVRLRFARTPTIAVVLARSASRVAEAEVVVRVETRVRSWPHDVPAYALARALDLIARLPTYGVPMMRASRSHLIETVWVLGLDERSGWTLRSVEPWMTGRHRLRDDATGEAEEIEELRSEAVRELEDAYGTDPIPSELADNLPDDQQLAADELGMVDSRFDRQVIEASVEEIADRWAMASDGEHAPLAPVVAEPKVTDELLSKGIAIRSPEVRSVRVVRVHRYRTPPEITVRLKLKAWRGKPDPGYWEGYGVTRTEECRWRLRAGSSPEHPWLLIDPSDWPQY
jgi:hypothetical protein